MVSILGYNLRRADFSQTYRFHAFGRHLSPNYLDNKQMITWSLFSTYGKNILVQKILKIHRVDPEENTSQTFRQADGQMNRTDFKGFLPQSGGSIMFFANSK